jgi:protein-glutamine gamma-glutamyltransferase
MAIAPPPEVVVPDALPPGFGDAPAPDSRPRAALRLVCLGALLVLGLVRWYDLLDNASKLTPALFALGCMVGAAGLWLVPRRRWWLVALAAVAGVVVGLGAGLLVAGVPLWMLDPRDWGSLGPGLSSGINALPGVTVPYAGTGDWLRIVIGLGGLALAVVSALLAGLRRPGWALVPVFVLLAVPAIQMSPHHPWMVGAAITVPLVLYVLAGRFTGRVAFGTGLLLVAALGVGLVVGPLLDRKDPAIDIQAIADALQPDKPDVFEWSHSYGPLDWPRDGRVLARIETTNDEAAYWKAEDLDLFNGVGWTEDSGLASRVPAAVGLDAHPEWKTDVRVSIGDMTTRDFIAPGDTLSVSRAPRQPVSTRPGGFGVATNQDPLGSGNAYRAESYVARPTAKQLRESGTDYPPYLVGELSMLTPADGSAGRAFIRFAPFGSGESDQAYGPGVQTGDTDALLDQSGYGRVRKLARRLSAGAQTPYEVVQRVQDYLGGSQFTYQEDVPEHRLPIPAFLFGDKAGYCQHFSAAMALLLRMAGVPARVSAGFAPGQFDSDKGQYVVRDLDAHSWVEVWFNGIGWVTFDPTPSASPARSQTSSEASGAALSSSVPGGPQPRGSIGGADPGPQDPVGPSSGDGSSGGGFPWAIMAGIAALIAAIAVAPAVWRRWTARRDRERDEDEQVAELRRALRRTGRDVAADTTLLELERRFAGDPGARAYIRALALRRYADDAAGPTREERKALRVALARGLGLRGRVRAWWALPPHGLH